MQEKMGQETKARAAGSEAAARDLHAGGRRPSSAGQGTKARGAGSEVGAAGAEVGGKPPKRHSIQEVIDAVSGATWNTRNRIMEDLFKEELAASGGGMPTFAPPGSSIENERGK